MQLVDLAAGTFNPMVYKFGGSSHGMTLLSVNSAIAWPIFSCLWLPEVDPLKTKVATL